MSKTVEDLKQVYLDAWCAAEGDAISAGIAAVVRALRDECDRVLPCDRKFSRNQVWEVFNEILGDAGNEKLAGGTSAHSGEAGYQTRPAEPTPATDPAPIKFTEVK